MTKDEQHTEIGRLVMAYVEAGRSISCMRSKMDRTVKALTDLNKELERGPDLKIVQTAVSNAKMAIGDMDMQVALTELAEAWQERSRMRDRLKGLGLVELL